MDRCHHHKVASALDNDGHWVADLRNNLTNDMENSHFRYKIEAHLLKVFVFGHDGDGHGVHLVVIEVELDASGRRADEVPPVLDKKELLYS